MSGYTPGPWFFVQGAKSSWITAHNVSDGGDIVCCQPDEAAMASMRKWAANARLIAAAPDMLETLKLAVETFQEIEWALKLFQRPTLASACKTAADATLKVIAKATSVS
jgi:hypothetical protein